jgi:small redox-active disulfide protein 2
MQIQVLGAGCSSCKKLYDMASEIIEDLKLDVKVDYITDVSKIVELGIMTSPVLTVNGKPVMIGFIPNKEKIKDAIVKVLA